MVPDPAAAAQFYQELFGWVSEPGAPAGGYRMCMLHGRAVAGIGSPQPGDDVPVAWTTYLGVADIKATVGKVTAAGGEVLMDPVHVMSEGWLAVAADPTGAVFGMWQPGRHRGSEPSQRHGALTWNECMTRRYEAAKAFYATVFGYQVEDVGDGSPFRYTVLRAGGENVAGVGELGADVPAGVPAYWLCYFATDDADTTVATATRLGARVDLGPWDSPYGRMAVLTGPQGEVFAVMSR
jgi:predicted enzyme related to lactoylglutathione lyase